MIQNYRPTSADPSTISLQYQSGNLFQRRLHLEEHGTEYDASQSIKFSTRNLWESQIGLCYYFSYWLDLWRRPWLLRRLRWDQVWLVAWVVELQIPSDIFIYCLDVIMERRIANPMNFSVTTDDACLSMFRSFTSSVYCMIKWAVTFTTEA